MITLRLMTVTAALLFVLLQRVDVKVRLRDSLFIKINLNIIALVLYETKEKDKHLKDIFDAINKLPIFLKSIKYLLSKSNVILAFREETFLSDSPTIVTRIGSILSAQIIITYLIAVLASNRLLVVIRSFFYAKMLRTGYEISNNDLRR